MYVSRYCIHPFFNIPDFRSWHISTSWYKIAYTVIEDFIHFTHLLILHVQICEFMIWYFHSNFKPVLFDKSTDAQILLNADPFTLLAFHPCDHRNPVFVHMLPLSPPTPTAKQAQQFSPPWHQQSGTAGEWPIMQFSLAFSVGGFPFFLFFFLPPSLPTPLCPHPLGLQTS